MILLVSAAFAYGYSHDIGVALIVVCIVLVLLPCRWDPAIQWKERQTRPDCYGDWPHYHPQEAAERDCRHCLHGMACHEDTPYHPRVPPPRPEGSPPPARPQR